MKKMATFLLVCLLVVALGAPSWADSHRHRIYYERDCAFDDIDLDIEDGTIILTHDRRRDEIVEITEEYELFVNGGKVELDDFQQELVTEFYDSVTELVKYAKRLGWEGAKIGVEGAKLGLNALGRLMQVAFTSYDTEDFERDMEREAERIEAKAEQLEEKAEKVEDLAHDVEDLAYELEDAIPELAELDWLY